jgi:hypothetical protein
MELIEKEKAEKIVENNLKQQENHDNAIKILGKALKTEKHRLVLIKNTELE